MKTIFKIPYPNTKEGRAEWSRRYGFNAYWEGKHWRERKRDADYWHQLVHVELRHQGINRHIIHKPVMIVFYWNDRLDLDNHGAMGKMILDALKGWIIADDDRRYVTGVAHFFHNESYIGVEIIEEKEKIE